MASYLDKGFRQQQGMFTVLFLVAFAVGIPALLIASGLGLSERNREIGICKAVGWQTTDVMLMVTFEQAFLSVIAACLAVLVSYVWVRLFNGVLVAQFFISELGNIAPFPVPAQFSPAAAALALLLCLTITMVGSLYTTWRLATRFRPRAFANEVTCQCPLRFEPASSQGSIPPCEAILYEQSIRWTWNWQPGEMAVVSGPSASGRRPCSA